MLQAQGMPEHETDGEGLVIARLVPSLTLDDWKTMLERPELAGLKDWIALPLAGDTLPFLHHLQSRLEELAWQTEHDPLTGLHNRRAFDRILSQELNRAQRQHSRLALAIIDLDNFKRVNDTYGHPCGDMALQTLARVLTAGKRGYDVAARTGGEEFSLILPGAGMRRARAMVQRLLETFSEQDIHCSPEGQDLPPFRCSFSAGLAITRGASRVRPTEFISLADQALYRAKHAGKACVEACLTMDEETMVRSTLVQSNEKRFLLSNASGKGMLDDDDGLFFPEDA
ncbi:putative GGDEF domain protein [Megalodesulfovibrio gigas DSM 1382 = ATCC 19364]|uniref:diguanylate cyclase n=2 Tax=Megalodesulfovibrio gigas TaxID=879 RepID=T2GEY3_MEGG1|nr:putative GGDEF domain protein [Megalodesulfovibrio gigas DSM 1382 = ATCC 19364]